MRVLVTGSTGQLGRELMRLAPAGVTLLAPARDALDMASAALEERVVALAPALILNAAAYTAVDRAESERQTAFAVNADAPAALARAAARIGARLLQVSTDFVFDGANSCPYAPDAPLAPLGAYGESKAEGEGRVRGILPDAVILRTAWVYAAHGTNFVHTMLRLMRERERIGVVADQIGTPTWARGLAAAAWELGLAGDAAGIWHWTDLGVASWYDFAVAIREEALSRGLLPRAAAVEPIRTEDYPTPARRPHYSVLDKSATLARLQAPSCHWRESLRGMLDELAATGGG